MGGEAPGGLWFFPHTWCFTKGLFGPTPKGGKPGGGHQKKGPGEKKGGNPLGRKGKLGAELGGEKTLWGQKLGGGKGERNFW